MNLTYSYNPDGVINADIILARSVISITQNPLAISNEQFDNALSMSCNNLLINGIGCTINLVRLLTRR